MSKSVPMVLVVVQGGPGTFATMLSAAMSAKPMVVLAGSGGAATALHAFVGGGLQDVEERFQAQGPLMQRIKDLNDVYQGKMLKFFSLSSSVPDASGASAHDMCEMMLEGIIDMIGQRPAWHSLPVGARVVDPVRGEGEVVGILEEGVREMRFSKEDEKQVYTPLQMQDLSFSVKDVVSSNERADENGQLLGKALNLCVAWDLPQMVERVLASDKKAKSVPPLLGVGSLPEERNPARIPPHVSHTRIGHVV